MTTGETRGLFTLYGDFRVFVLYSLGRMLFHMSLLLKGEEADGLRIMLASKDKLGPKIFTELMHSGKFYQSAKNCIIFFYFESPLKRRLRLKSFRKIFWFLFFIFRPLWNSRLTAWWPSNRTFFKIGIRVGQRSNLTFIGGKHFSEQRFIFSKAAYI